MRALVLRAASGTSAAAKAPLRRPRSAVGQAPKSQTDAKAASDQVAGAARQRPRLREPLGAVRSQHSRALAVARNRRFCGDIRIVLMSGGSAGQKGPLGCSRGAAGEVAGPGRSCSRPGPGPAESRCPSATGSANRAAIWVRWPAVRRARVGEPQRGPGRRTSRLRLSAWPECRVTSIGGDLQRRIPRIAAVVLRVRRRPAARLQPTHRARPCRASRGTRRPRSGLHARAGRGGSTAGRRAPRSRPVPAPTGAAPSAESTSRIRSGSASALCTPCQAFAAAGRTGTGPRRCSPVDSGGGRSGEIRIHAQFGIPASCRRDSHPPPVPRRASSQ